MENIITCIQCGARFEPHEAEVIDSEDAFCPVCERKVPDLRFPKTEKELAKQADIRRTLIYAINKIEK